MVFLPKTVRILFLLIMGLAVAGAPDALGQHFRFGKNKVQYRTHAWQFLQTSHFDVYYYDGGQYLAEFTAHAAEDALRQISRLFQYTVTDRIPILVYQNHIDFSVTNAVDLPAFSEGIGGVTELYKNRIAMPFMGDYRDYRRVLHHEIVHAVLNDMFYGGSVQSILQNNIQLRLPLWFNEGLAEYSALRWDTRSDMYLREAILSDRLPPIQRLSGYYAYRGGQGVWDFIVEQYGQEKIGEILQRLKMTRSVDMAFQRAIGLNLDQLTEQWHKSLREIHFPEVTSRESMEYAGRAIVTRDRGYYNTSPVLSPLGDMVAFVTTHGTLFDIYVASTGDGQVMRRLVRGQTSPDFESIRILTPGLSWDPNGTHIAAAVRTGGRDEIAVIDVRTGEVRHHRVRGVDEIFSLAWSPIGRYIAFGGSSNAQQDIYLFDLATGEVRNLTDDVFSDHEPAWSPDGRHLVFHSDRGDNVEVGRFRRDNHDPATYVFRDFDIFLLDTETVRVRRLTHGSRFDNRSARFGSQEDRILFISDRNGIYNLYEKELASGQEWAITNDVIGMTQLAVSNDGSRAAMVRLKDGTPSIFTLDQPFGRRVHGSELPPSVWAERVSSHFAERSAAATLAQASLQRQNPFLRAAVQRRERTLAAPSFAPDTLIAGGDLQTDEIIETAEEGYGRVRIDFRNYNFGESYSRARSSIADFRDERFEPIGNIDEEGRLVSRRYRLRFSPDLIYGAAGYDMLYGVQGLTQMMFSDMLGNHRIFVASNLLIDLRNSDYIVAYSYLPRRWNWNVAVYHLSRLLPDYERLTYHRYRQYGISTGISYPFDKFRRIEMEAGLLGVSQSDIGDPRIPSSTRTILYPSVTYTKDVTTPGMLFPVEGSRFAVSLSGSPGNVAGDQIRFLTAMADGRFYSSFGRGLYSVAGRLSGGASIGPNRQMFYTSGVHNWLNRRFDETRGFPIEDVSDFLFARPLVPLRGFDINARNGAHYGLANGELRFPLVAALLPGPLPVLPLYNLQGTAFIDAAVLWGRQGEDVPLRIISRTDAGRFEDLLIGTGFGLRTILLGYPFRLDFAWPFDGTSFGPRRTYLSIGFDF
jgi:Tol biopolymer transport system component